MNNAKRLWLFLIILLVSTFSVLIWTGADIYRKAPPMPDKVVSAGGETIFTRADIDKGRVVWQSMGGMQLGSIWGHGSYVAPDWSADWLHRELIAVMDIWAQRDLGAADYQSLTAEQKAAMEGRLR